MATHSSVLAWRIPGMGEPSGLLSMGSHRVGHDWSDLAAAAAAISGAENATAPRLLVLAVAHLLLCLQGERTLYSSWLALLWYLVNPLFCECTRVHWALLEPFIGKVFWLVFFFFFFFLVSLVIPRFGLLFHIRSLRLSSGHSGQVLTLSTAGTATSPCPAATCWWQMWASGPLLYQVWYVFCEFFFSPSWLCCPLRFQNSPTDTPVGHAFWFPTVWRLLPNSFSRMGVHP